MKHRSVDRMPLTGEQLKGLAVRLGYGEDGDELLINEYRRVTRSIRQIYDAFFQAGVSRVFCARFVGNGNLKECHESRVLANSNCGICSDFRPGFWV